LDPNHKELVLRSVARDLDDGRFRLKSSATHFTLTVNRGSRIAELLTYSPKQFVVGVEENPYLSSFLRYTSSAYNVQWSEGKSHAYCADIPPQLADHTKTIAKNRDCLLVINAVVAGLTDSFAQVSINQAKLAKVQVMPLAKVLVHVPLNLTWDLLWLDGTSTSSSPHLLMDSLISAKDYLQQFLCVIIDGTNANEGMGLLGEQGFLLVKTGSINGTLWINSRKAALEKFKADQYSCLSGSNGGDELLLRGALSKAISQRIVEFESLLPGKNVRGYTASSYTASSLSLWTQRHQAIKSSKASVLSALWPLNQNGFLQLGPSITHFTLDLGVNRGNTVAKFLEDIPSQFVIGIEANPYLASMHNMASSTHSVLTDASGKQHPYCGSVYGELGEKTSVIEKCRDRVLILNVAAASTAGVVQFNMGYGWVDGAPDDVGSMYEWEDESMQKKGQGNQVSVYKMRLDALLRFVPPSLTWDCLKIDIQGADADALISAADFVDNFKCVVGEFDTNAYKVPTGTVTDPAAFMKSHNFIDVERCNGSRKGSFWLNTRFLTNFKAKDYNCFVYDESRSHSAVLAAIARYEGAAAPLQCQDT
jgi:hypothetical protein